jgi:glycerol-3-phosphate O-acyltransferase/dihydroxyacetone phosphate acyltransferase
MARELLWSEDRDIPSPQFRAVSQELTDLFEDESAPTEVQEIKGKLLELYAALKSASLTNASLTSRTLPNDLDPSAAVELPRRFTMLWHLLGDSLASLVRLPFFLLPLLFHMPLYIIAKRVGKIITADEVEAEAQNKIVLGLLVLLVAYPALFAFLWLLLFLNPIGGAIAFIL